MAEIVKQINMAHLYSSHPSSGAPILNAVSLPIFYLAVPLFKCFRVLWIQWDFINRRIINVVCRLL